MSESVHRADSEALAELRDARERLETAQQRIERQGGGDEAAVEEAATAYRNATELLESYVDRATGTGRENFQAYIELEGKFDALVEGLNDDLQGREAFEAALDAIDKRRLSESDFERAEAELEPAKQYADLLDEREAAREALGAARTNAGQRLGEIDDELAEAERLLELSHADFDAPVERLREPIEAYDEGVREAFEEYRSNASAREVFAFLDRTRWYPFVDYELPPADLESYVETNPAGEYTIDELLEYAEYSRSKLSHYVDDADELKRQVATQQTYLDGIDAEPLTVGWPPEPAGVLRRRTREYRPFVDRIADDETVALLREVRLFARDPDYDRLQTAAQAADQLTSEERKRLADGRVADELEALRNEREQLAAALEVDDPV
ncbi:hypothetical protein HALLA_04850 [Halostagnicola larsenii XH-48]|uniref:Uncharacterized protein n=1 Tax=Halostagnicola larsenii XH-48 TaxID=797299 RepID=W0JM05_9EURY|nr:hypothetical protein [Halostagnicola larsenii]AHF98301.1 hypothetical protein HALLA_04850 [Halostagnicola larsenii XH-48]